MNVLVLGDSWGCDFGDPSHQMPLRSLEPQNTWIRYSDHVIYNCSIFGGSNIATLNAGKTFLQNKINNKAKPIDLIVWYYTELGRDNHHTNFVFLNNRMYTFNYPLLGTVKIEDSLDWLHNETYKLASEIKTMYPNAKWAIVGGHASIYKPADYDWADFIIEDLISELLGYHVPTSHFQCADHYKNSSSKNIDILESELSKYESLLSVRETESMFIDNVHIDSHIRHNLVTDRILDHFSPKNT